MLLQERGVAEWRIGTLADEVERSIEGEKSYQGICSGCWWWLLIGVYDGSPNQHLPFNHSTTFKTPSILTLLNHKFPKATTIQNHQRPQTTNRQEATINTTKQRTNALVAQGDGVADRGAGLGGLVESLEGGHREGKVLQGEVLQEQAQQVSCQVGLQRLLVRVRLRYVAQHFATCSSVGVLVRVCVCVCVCVYVCLD